MHMQPESVTSMALLNRSHPLPEPPLGDDALGLSPLTDGVSAAPQATMPLTPSGGADDDGELELVLLLGSEEDEDEDRSDVGGSGRVSSDDGDDDHALLELLCLHDADALQIESESGGGSGGDDTHHGASSPGYHQQSVVSPSSGLEQDDPGSHTSALQQKPMAKEKPRRNRKRPKQEMDALRIEERELSEKLTQLQEQLEQQQQNALVASSQEGSLVVKIALSKETANTLARPGQPIVNTPSTLLPSSAGIWQSLAWFQREDVRAAIRENTRLRALFQCQLQMLGRLEAMYLQYSSQNELSALLQEWSDPSGTALTKRARVGHPLDDDLAIFASLGRDFDAQYLKTDSIFESAGLANVDSGRVRQEMLPKRGANGIYFLESLHSKTIPHDLHAHDAMTWSVLASEDLHAHHGAYEVRELTHEVVCRKIVNQIRLPLGESTLIRRTALKRYIEEDRVVLVWDAVLEVTGSVSMRLRERGWKVLRRPRIIPADHNGSEPISVEQWCVRVTPELSTTYSEEDIAAGSLTNAIVAAYRRHLKLMHHVDRNVFAAQFKKALDALASRLNSQ